MFDSYFCKQNENDNQIIISNFVAAQRALKFEFFELQTSANHKRAHLALKRKGTKSYFATEKLLKKTLTTSVVAAKHGAYLSRNEQS